MGKHRLVSAQGIPQSSDYGVSRGVIEAWRFRALLGMATRHAACNCRSYSEHRDLALIAECGGPLATIHVERYRIEQAQRRDIAKMAPWMSAADVDAIIAWKPGDFLTVPGTRYRPLYAEKRCVCGRWRGEHLFAGDLDGDDLSKLSDDRTMMCPDRVGLWFTPEDTAAR